MVGAGSPAKVVEQNGSVTNSGLRGEGTWTIPQPTGSERNGGKGSPQGRQKGGNAKKLKKRL